MLYAYCALNLHANLRGIVPVIKRVKLPQPRVSIRNGGEKMIYNISQLMIRSAPKQPG